jgi:hypothetical protein
LTVADTTDIAVTVLVVTAGQATGGIDAAMSP